MNWGLCGHWTSRNTSMYLENTKEISRGTLFFWRVCNCVETYHRSHLNPVIQFHFNSVVRQELNTVYMVTIFLCVKKVHFVHFGNSSTCDSYK